MSKDIQNQLVTCQTCAVLGKAYDNNVFAHSCINDLGSLFQAIRQTSRKHSTIYHLAGIGQYLADDWSNALESEGETLIELKKLQ